MIAGKLLCKRLEKIGQSHRRQMAKVMERAKWEDFTRWHMLIALDGSSYSSTFRNYCYTSFNFMAKFKVSTLSLGTHRSW